MQALLKRVCDWCSLWDINVNSNKSAVIHFHHLSGSLTTATFTLAELVIPIVRKYTYLVGLDQLFLFSYLLFYSSILKPFAYYSY